MLFMTIFTYEPDKREAVIKRRLQGPQAPEGTKILGEWVDLTGRRVFRLGEVDTAEQLLAAHMAWTDVGTCDTVPVMPTEEVLKLLQKG